MMLSRVSFLFVLPRTPWFYTLSLHDALPISGHVGMEIRHALPQAGDRQRVADHAAVCKCTQHLPARMCGHHEHGDRDRKSTRLNSSHRCISYAVFCLKKKTTRNRTTHMHATH